ncbi:DUF6965 family protein [Dyadobacter psychrotolerans]|uniref:DUF6965 domain-containing protein n=1 Tax=Dyadobacter psychrotolerans TaxID=2541721 RepID=A0A4R5E237_9BACT|nr:hypothetical protein [Dyadobacter psychrotolerans]TDE18295.1 hypothetical protein E0F88_01775 [Dyadobacter psychrotolerans]
MTIQEHEQELADLHLFFKAATFPTPPVKLNRYMTLHDPKGFVEIEAEAITRYKGNDELRDNKFKHLRELKALMTGG